MSKTDNLTPIGTTLQTADRHLGIIRTWRVVSHVFFGPLGRVVEMVALEGTEAIAREEATTCPQR